MESLTLINAGGGRNHPPPSESRVFSAPEHPVNPRPVNLRRPDQRALSYLSRFSHGGPIKFERTFFQIAKLRFSILILKGLSSKLGA